MSEPRTVTLSQQEMEAAIGAAYGAHPQLGQMGKWFLNLAARAAAVAAMEVLIAKLKETEEAKT